MNVSELLQRAWVAVEEARLPPEMRPVAFREAIRLLAPEPRGSTRPAGPSRGGSVADGSSDSGSALDISEEEMYDRVVQGTGVDRSRLERVVHLDDDGPRISLQGLKLGQKSAEKIRNVAKILTIVRAFGLQEDETPLQIIRTECVRLRVHDAANFSTHVKNLEGFVTSGSGQNRRIRAKGPGIAAFPALVNELLGESGEPGS